MLQQVQKAVNKLGGIGKKASRIAGITAEKEIEIIKLAKRFKENFKKELLDLKGHRKIKIIDCKRGGDYHNYLEFQTEFNGGIENAKKFFYMLTDKVPNKDFIQETIIESSKAIEITYRTISKSKLPKIEIKDHFRNYVKK